MRGTSGFLLLVVGLLLLWLVVTGRLQNAAAAWGALTGSPPAVEKPASVPDAAPGPPGPVPVAALGRLPGTLTLG